MDTRRQADSLAVSNLTVGTDCSTAVISDCQTMALCSLNSKNTPTAVQEEAKNTFNSGTMACQDFNKFDDPQTFGGLDNLVPTSTYPVIEGTEAENTSLTRNEGDGRAKGAEDTILSQNSGRFKSVPTEQTDYVSRTSKSPAAEGMEAEVTLAVQNSRGLCEPLSNKVKNHASQMSISPPRLPNPPRVLHICAVGNRKKIHTPLYGMSENLVVNSCNFDLTNQDEKFSSTFLALKNHVGTTHTSPVVGTTVNFFNDSDSAISHEKKMIGAQSSHNVEYFGGPAVPTHRFNKAMCPRSLRLAGATTGPVEARRLVEIKESALDMDLPINLGTTFTDDLLEMGAPEVIAGTKDMVLPINLATICTDDIIEMGAPNITSETKNLAESCESMIIDDEVQGKSNPECIYDMREKFALENLDFIGYKMTFENNNLPNLIFEEGKFSAELFAKFKKRRANLTRTLYRLFNNEISQPSRSKLSKFLNISQNGLKDADVLHKKHLSTKMFEEEETTKQGRWMEAAGLKINS